MMKRVSVPGSPRPAFSLPADSLALVLSCALLVGCGSETTRTPTAYPPVPPLPTEVVPRPPVTAEPLMWQPGYWDWNGSAYLWRPGQFVPAEGHGNLWMPGFWQQGPSGWTWQPPHWTS
jgi:hypothetical protein